MHMPCLYRAVARFQQCRSLLLRVFVSDFKCQLLGLLVHIRLASSHSGSPSGKFECSMVLLNMLKFPVCQRLSHIALCWCLFADSNTCASCSLTDFAISCIGPCSRKRGAAVMQMVCLRDRAATRSALCTILTALVQ